MLLKNFQTKLQIYLNANCRAVIKQAIFDKLLFLKAKLVFSVSWATKNRMLGFSPLTKSDLSQNQYNLKIDLNLRKN